MASGIQSFTTHVVVRFGRTDVTVRRVDMDRDCERWIVVLPDKSTGPLLAPIDGFDAAMEEASRVAMILEEARALRELARVVETRLERTDARV